MKILIQVKASLSFLFPLWVPFLWFPFQAVCLLEWGFLHRQGLSPFSSGHSPPLLLCQQVLLGVSCTGSCVIEAGAGSASQIQLGICLLLVDHGVFMCSKRCFNSCSMMVVWGLQSLLSPTPPVWWIGKAMAFKLCLEFGFSWNPPQSSVKPGRNLLSLTSG